MGAIFTFALSKLFNHNYSGLELMNTILSLSVISLLVSIAVYDYKHFIIPDGLVYSAISLSFIKMLTYMYENTLIGNDFILAILSGPIIASPLLIIWLASSGRVMGFGDVKLAVVFGYFFGIIDGMATLAYSFWIGAVIMILVMLLQLQYAAFSDVYNVFEIKLYGPRTKSFLQKYAPFILKDYALKKAIPFGTFMVIAFISQYIFELPFGTVEDFMMYMGIFY